MNSLVYPFDVTHTFTTHNNNFACVEDNDGPPLESNKEPGKYFTVVLDLFEGLFLDYFFKGNRLVEICGCNDVVNRIVKHRAINKFYEAIDSSVDRPKIRYLCNIDMRVFPFSSLEKHKRIIVVFERDEVSKVFYRNLSLPQSF